jgi:hypothetical protein
MADSGVFRINPLQAWQREAILKAAQLMRERLDNLPADPEANAALEGLLEVLDPPRRTVRLQREISESTRQAALTESSERRQKQRRGRDRRRVDLGPPPGIAERRKGPTRVGDRRNRK